MASFYRFWWLMKLQRMFFALCWRVFMLVYFGIGLGALGVLFLIESQFFMQVTQHTILGYGIAAIFEVAKVGTSMIKQAITIANRVTRVKISVLIQGITLVFQVSLIALSLICSVVVVTSYLEGSSPDMEKTIVRKSQPTDKQALAQQRSIVASTLVILKDGLNLDVNPATFISLFAMLISALFQATSYIVFGHIIAMQSREIEHLFEVKIHGTDAKKNCMPST